MATKESCPAAGEIDCGGDSGDGYGGRRRWSCYGGRDGDDTHPSYKAIENTGLDELLENIKSFYYSDSKDYINLIDYL